MVKASLFFFLILLGFFGSWSPLISVPVYKIIVLTAGSALLFYIASLARWKHVDQKLIRLTPLSTLFLLFLFWSALGLFMESNFICLDDGCVWGRNLVAAKLLKKVEIIKVGC